MYRSPTRHPLLGPAEVKGTATLLVEHADGDDDIWIYLPPCARCDD